MRGIMMFTIFKNLFSFQRYSSFQNVQIGKEMTPYTQPIMINYDEKRYRSQFVAEMLDPL